MRTFLEEVAQDLLNKLGNDLSKTAIVFPNKRARLFFDEYLAKQCDRPIWSPAYVSISDLMQQLADVKLADSIRLVCELYPIFCKATGKEESLDDFYFWGEILISDFDDVDKNLVDAQRLFSNLEDLKEMDSVDFLDEDQKRVISEFFHGFDDGKLTELQERFITLWSKLGGIYEEFHSHLKELGLAYEGMLYREVLAQVKENPQLLPYDHYVFVGFNVLNTVEREFFKLVQKQRKAMFYWDYDTFYTKTTPYRHEAGEFILRNLEIFPNELPEEYFNHLNGEKVVTYLSAPTENAQARYLPDWIRGHVKDGENERENAVVLCNEALLLPVLHAIPNSVKHTNITMGFPLAQTPVYSFINALMELQTSGYRPKSGRFTFAAVQAVLKHPYTQQLSPEAGLLMRELTHNNRFFPTPQELQKDDLLKLVFTPQVGLVNLSVYLEEVLKELTHVYMADESEQTHLVQLYQESIFKGYTLVNRLYNLIESGILTIEVGMWKSLLSRLLSAATIPFHGEPAIGMQVMGVLETRNLDFKNLIVMSLNEGQLPKANNTTSFIPYNLRQAYGMTTIEHKNAVYAYYFYRLIQRAEHVTLVYNTSTDGLNQGEWSRFMLQFLIEWNHPIVQKCLEATQAPQDQREISIEKSADVMQRLRNRFDLNTNRDALVLSPSALNMYMTCPLKFYFRYVSHLKAPDEVTDEIDSALFGTIFHLSAQLVYEELTQHGAMVRKEDLEALLKDEPRLQNFVDRAFKMKFFHVPESQKPEYNGIQLINSKVILDYLKQLLRIDAKYAPFEMLYMEKGTQEEHVLDDEKQPLKLKLGGTIDRMDRKNGTLRIVDYKTGGNPEVPYSIEQLFIPAKDRPHYVFQTFLYSSIVCQKCKEKIAPALLFIHHASDVNYCPVIEMGEKRKPKEKVTDFASLDAEFREELDKLLREIFLSDKPFTQTELEKNCEYCDFKALCKR